MNIYGFPHKGIRIALGQLSKLSGTTDYTSAQSVSKLHALTNEVVTILDLHLHSEESVVLPALEAKIPGSSDENLEEHAALDKQEKEMAALMDKIAADPDPASGVAFYEAVNDFISKYFAHMAMEESDINQIIWANFNDEEIMSWHGQIMSTLTPDQIMLWFKYIVPALNPMERQIILGGFKANAPQEFYSAVLNMLAGYLPSEDHAQIVAF